MMIDHDIKSKQSTFNEKNTNQSYAFILLMEE